MKFNLTPEELKQRYAELDQQAQEQKRDDLRNVLFRYIDRCRTEVTGSTNLAAVVPTELLTKSHVGMKAFAIMDVGNVPVSTEQIAALLRLVEEL